MAELVPTPVLTGPVAESTELRAAREGAKASAAPGVDAAGQPGLSINFTTW